MERLEAPRSVHGTSGRRGGPARGRRPATQLQQGALERTVLFVTAPKVSAKCDATETRQTRSRRPLCREPGVWGRRRHSCSEVSGTGCPWGEVFRAVWSGELACCHVRVSLTLSYLADGRWWRPGAVSGATRPC
eukprot:1348352-Prymnesium_polylepis.2